MKKITRNLFLILSLSSLVAPARIVAQEEEIHFCHTNEKIDELKMSDPAIAADIEFSQQQLEEWTQYYLENEYDGSERSAIYTIPVVFHVIHTNGPENISDAQIHDAVDLLNDNFNKMNASWSTVNPAFLGIVADCQIEFKLARKKNNGACTNGITRTYSETTNADVGNDQVAAVQAAQGNWPGNKYLNIFVVKDAGGAAGYTTYPANWSSTNMSNGIKILHNYVGSIGTSNLNVSTALTHEVGHWLNLKHCWGDTNNPGLAGNCADDDDVTDTPNTIGWTSCNVNGSSCSSLDNVENYMEYSYCSKMYTEGQKARMHAALNSNIGDRDNVVSASNLIATGVSLPDALCQVNFSGDKTEICAGSSITFTDESYNFVSSTNWTFSGGTPNVSSSSNPTITYNTPGVYNVSLQASDGSTTLTNTKTNYIVVLPNPGDPLPYTEGFETLTAFPDYQRFTVRNDDNGQAWQITSTASSSGSKCVRLNNYSASVTGTLDAFMSAPIDLSGVDPGDNIVFNFRYAYHKRTTADDEWLRFYISNDCGETWVLRKNLHGSGLSSAVSSTSYVPVSSDWTSVSITNITSSYYVSNFRFKFEFESDGGNNIYIDDINLYPASMTGIDEQNEVSGLSIYPNPVTDMMQINIQVQNASEYRVTVHNVLGEEVGVIYQGQLSPGSNQFGYSTLSLAPGVYFIRSENEGVVTTHKFVKK